MWAPLQLRIGWRDLLSGLIATVFPSRRKAVLGALESYWPGSETMAAYSVRSGFDLVLQALDLEPGDEVIFSALNIRGMVNIARKHGLQPVPVDLDIDHMAPSPDGLKKAITPRSRVFVMAHLFGTRVDVAPVFECAREHGLFVFEDCAQAFDGRAYAGHPLADLSAFSFGPLKIATALGGALLRARDKAFLEKLRAIQAAYPRQTARDQAARLVKFAAFKLVLTRPAMALINRRIKATGGSFDSTVGDRVRNVARLAGFRKLRYQPSAALLALMWRRIERHERGDMSDYARAGRKLTHLLDGSVVLPAQHNPTHNYWVYPILAENPAGFLDGLRKHGFSSAVLSRSKTVDAPPGRPDLDPACARSALDDLVILPCYPRMPDRELERQAGIVKELARKFATGRTRRYCRPDGKS